MLKNTKASQSLILANTLPFFKKKSFSGNSILIQGVTCGFVSVTLHNILLISNLVSKPDTYPFGIKNHQLRFNGANQFGYRWSQ
jgi:hypothetical protein